MELWSGSTDPVVSTTKVSGGLTTWVELERGHSLQVQLSTHLLPTLHLPSSEQSQAATGGLAAGLGLHRQSTQDGAVALVQCSSAAQLQPGVRQGCCNCDGGGAVGGLAKQILLVTVKHCSPVAGSSSASAKSSFSSLLVDGRSGLYTGKPLQVNLRCIQCHRVNTAQLKCQMICLRRLFTKQH